MTDDPQAQEARRIAEVCARAALSYVGMDLSPVARLELAAAIIAAALRSKDEALREAEGKLADVGLAIASYGGNGAHENLAQALHELVDRRKRESAAARQKAEAPEPTSGMDTEEH